MIIVLFLCLLTATPIVFFVLSPLLSNNFKKPLTQIFDDFSSEKELRNVTFLRDFLFQKLIYGRSEHEDIDKLTENESLALLVTLCERLQQAELSWLPSQIQKPNSDRIFEKGSSLLDCLFFILISFLFSLGILATNSSFSLESQTVRTASEKVATPSDVTIPPPTILPGKGYWLPSVNQFILIPAQGKLNVYYVGMFNNTFNAKGAIVQIPLPKDFYNLQIYGNPNLIMEKNQEGGSPVINTPLSSGVNQISVEFSLPALSGNTIWRPSDLIILPGVTIFMMPEYSSGLRNLFSNFSDTANIWPPRITNIPNSFRSFVGPDPLDNNAASQKDPNHLSRQLVRVGNQSSEFPTFDINGILPSRTPIYVLSVFFAFFLFGVTAFCIFKTSK
ncbi:hypothetical protein GCL60_04755 [Silvanigrella paludirubra]|uniref:Uncharacterized protein n=1 Tax=Silvanigrella paludirubra TaxID=2499159 RepID=A0A6N6VU23_9BACT|nr:hypothetical protein [Silvanigrella paludirubra]KAB8039571.1 hypothetical protein GCL60_04755 [Silvanigrella paludirubra]